MIDGISISEYRELEPLYDKVLADMAGLKTVSITVLQRVYVIGYNRAARLVERLAAEGHLNYDPLTGRYSKRR